MVLSNGLALLINGRDRLEPFIFQARAGMDRVFIHSTYMISLFEKKGLVRAFRELHLKVVLDRSTPNSIPNYSPFSWSCRHMRGIPMAIFILGSDFLCSCAYVGCSILSCFLSNRGSLRLHGDTAVVQTRFGLG